MPQFSFTVLDQEGRRTSGTIDAADRDAALRMLAEKNLAVTDLVPIERRRSRLLRYLGIWKGRVSMEELVAFTQETAILLNAGIPLKRSMDILAQECESSFLKRIIIELTSGLAYGRPFSELLERTPRVFSPLYVTMVAIGETAGALPLTLMNLATYLENAQNLKRKIKTALTYPLLIVALAFVMLFFVFYYGIPRVEEVYNGLNTSLPAPTLFVLSISHLIKNNWIVLISVLSLVTVFSYRFAVSLRGRLFLDDFLMRAPVLGVILRKFAITRLARALSTLYSRGVPILQSMELVANSTGSPVMRKIIMNAIESIKEGKLIVEPLRRSKVFTPVSINMIAVGEESGELDVMLNKLADFYEAQLEATLRNVAGLVEPLLIMGVGVLTAGIILAMGLPFLNLISAFH